MVETGDYLVPRLQHEPFLDKPPLSLWGIAFGLRFFGHSEWGARVFHALCFVLTGLLVDRLGTSLGSRREGWAGMAIWATMVLPVAAANVLTPDSPLGLWTTAAANAFIRKYRDILIVIVLARLGGVQGTKPGPQ